jgi:hypothetical protein
MPTYDRRLTLEYQNLYSRYGALLIGVMAAYAMTFHKQALQHFYSRRKIVNVIGCLCLALMVVIAFTSFGYPASTPTTVEAYFFVVWDRRRNPQGALMAYLSPSRATLLLTLPCARDAAALDLSQKHMAAFEISGSLPYDRDELHLRMFSCLICVD